MADTIYALATAPGKSGVAVIRISGSKSWEVVCALAGDVPPPRLASLRTLRDADGEVLDEALVICFSEGASFTGEQSAEFQIHGGLAVIEAVLSGISATGLGRMAEAGEFTRRALSNDRLDLVKVQGLADVIDAETELQRTSALRVMRGELSDRVLGWRGTLLRAVALLEATIDFADEDVPVEVEPEVRELLLVLAMSIRDELAGSKARRKLRTGFEVAIVGRPNVGKSSLLNMLARHDAAIVSEQAGTTRDIIEVMIDINGLPVKFLDTAGIRESTDAVENLGIERAISRASAADLRILIHEGEAGHSPQISLKDGDISLRAKADLHGLGGISSKTGEGLSELLSSVRDRLWSAADEGSLVSRARDIELLRSAQSALNDVLAQENWSEEIIADNLRQAVRFLESIIGGVDVEDVLGEIFSSFCIGK